MYFCSHFLHYFFICTNIHISIGTFNRTFVLTIIEGFLNQALNIHISSYTGRIFSLNKIVLFLIKIVLLLFFIQCNQRYCDQFNQTKIYLYLLKIKMHTFERDRFHVACLINNFFVSFQIVFHNYMIYSSRFIFESVHVIKNRPFHFIHFI